MHAAETTKLNDNQKRVYNYVLEQIAGESLALGSVIPTEVALAAQLQTTRMNAHRAVKQLEAQGILSRHKRGGTRIARIPNSFGLGDLRRRVTDSVTVLNPLRPEVAQIHWNAEIVNALASGLRAHGLGLNVVDVSGIAAVAALENLLRGLARTGVRALLCISGAWLNEALRERPELFFAYHREVFVFGRDIVDWSLYPYNTVSVDLFNEGVMATEYAHAQGYARLVCGVQGNLAELPWFSARRAGLQCGLRRLRGSEPTLPLLHLESDATGLAAALAGEGRTMLVAANDHTAVPFAERIAQLTGRIAGRDYGLLSFDHDPRFAAHRLTTIAPPLHEIGAALAELMTGTAGRASDRTCFVKIKSRLIPGKTC